MRIFSFASVLRQGIAFCLLLSACAAADHRANNSGDLTKAEALRAAKRWAFLAGASDVAGLDALLAPSYVHTHGTGLIETKEQFLAALRTGARDYVRCKIIGSEVRLLGRAAIVTGTLDFKVVATGRKIEGTNRFMMVLERTARGVKVVAYQATPLKRKE